MCGVAALFAYSGATGKASSAEIERICSRMACRGPDGSGLWTSPDGRVALGHRRLAIIDLSDAGAQPMSDAEGRCVISFNGEIYNYKSLRAGLEAKGHRFRSGSDTEVLLHLYLEHGPGMVRELRGMFAFALWDSVRGGLLLARDPFGIKPLYLADDGSTVRVASEVKGLLASGAVSRDPDPAGHVGFFIWGHLPEPYTLYRAVRAVPAGSTIWIDAFGKQTLDEYADLAQMLGNPSVDHAMDPREAEGRLHEALLDSVRHHLVADVDVGVFLSAGLDSTTLTALASEVGGRVRTVTLGFEEFRGSRFDETTVAESVAKHYGTDHRTIWISKADFDRELDRVLDRMDQPSIDGVNSYFVARAASQAGLKVALSGLGGDEILGGYPSFREIPRLVNAVRCVPASRAVGKRLRALTAPIVGRLTSPKYAGLLEYGGDFGGAYLLRRGLFLPWEVNSLLDPELVEQGFEELQLLARLEQTASMTEDQRARVSALEGSWYMRNQLLRDTDWASMSHSLEVRVPLVDWTLWREVGALLHHAPHLDKRAMARAPKNALPQHVLERPKTGFVTPVRDWLFARGATARMPRGLRGWARYVYEAAA